MRVRTTSVSEEWPELAKERESSVGTGTERRALRHRKLGAPRMRRPSFRTCRTSSSLGIRFPSSEIQEAVQALENPKRD